MSVCAICGGPIAGKAGLCGGHALGADARWAMTNRVMCDLLHRGKLPVRIGTADLDEESYESVPCEITVV
jgi:hypothetical protein